MATAGRAVLAKPVSTDQKASDVTRTTRRAVRRILSSGGHSDCPCWFTRPIDLKDHQARAHPTTGSAHQCGTCGFACARKNIFDRHISDVHGGKIDNNAHWVPCIECKTMFSWINDGQNSEEPLCERYDIDGESVAGIEIQCQGLRVFIAKIDSTVASRSNSTAYLM